MFTSFLKLSELIVFILTLRVKFDLKVKRSFEKIFAISLRNITKIHVPSVAMRV